MNEEYVKIIFMSSSTVILYFKFELRTGNYTSWVIFFSRRNSTILSSSGTLKTNSISQVCFIWNIDHVTSLTDCFLRLADVHNCVSKQGEFFSLLRLRLRPRFSERQAVVPMLITSAPRILNCLEDSFL